MTIDNPIIFSQCYSNICHDHIHLRALIYKKGCYTSLILGSCAYRYQRAEKPILASQDDFGSVTSHVEPVHHGPGLHNHVAVAQLSHGSPRETRRRVPESEGFFEAVCEYT